MPIPIVGELVAVWGRALVYLETDACGVAIVIHPLHGIVSKRAIQLARRNLGLIISDMVEKGSLAVLMVISVSIMSMSMSMMMT
jgi:hypothetical protein